MSKRHIDLERLNLRHITREPEKAGAIVTVHASRYDDAGTPWIYLGECGLDYRESIRQWTLSAYLAADATDYEHDSAYALKLPLVGVEFMSVMYGCTELTGLIDPDALDDFRVPDPGYNPLLDPKSIQCKECKGKEKHRMVENFVPPANKALYEKVRGKRVTIVIGPTDGLSFED